MQTTPPPAGRANPLAAQIARDSAPLPPIPDDGSKPVILESQASYHENRAAMVAEAAATREGMDPVDAANLVLPAEILAIGGHAFPPIDARFLITLPILQRWLEARPVLHSEAMDVMLLAYGLAEPERAFRLATKEPDDLAGAVLGFCAAFKIADIRKLAAFVNAELARLNSDAEEQQISPKK